jgi:hypothetical protein
VAVHRGEEDLEAAGAGVDDPGVAQHGELVGGLLDRRGHPRADQGGGPDQVVAGGDPLVGGVRGGGDRREDGALDRLGDGLVGEVPGTVERLRVEGRVDLAVAGDHLDDGAQDLAQDHPGVAPGATQHAPRDHLGGGPAGPRRLLAQRFQAGPHGQGHVRAGVPVRDREDVEVVDHLPAGGEGRVDTLEQRGQLAGRQRRADGSVHRAAPPWPRSRPFAPTRATRPRGLPHGRGA